MTGKRVARIAVFVVLIILGGKIAVPIGYTPFTLQNFFVIAAGFFLGAKDGSLACLIYLVLGLIGLPIFSSGGGVHYVIAPTFGYIIGFYFGAYIAGKMLYSFSTLSPVKAFICGATGTLAIYLIGAGYQITIMILVLKVTERAALLSLANLPWMLVVDLVMVMILCLIFPRLTTMMKINSVKFQKRGKPALTENSNRCSKG